VALEWKYSTDSVDWEELSALYRAAPLGDKSAAHLRNVFGNSLFKCFAYQQSRLVAAGRALADGGDCSYISSSSRAGTRKSFCTPSRARSRSIGSSVSCA
jgi:hypothetical protein